MPICLAACSGPGGAARSGGATGSSATADGGAAGGGSVGGGSVGVRTTSAAAPGVLPDPAELDRARADVARLDDARLAAQLVVPRQEATGAAAAEVLRRSHAGGLVAFGDVVPTAPNLVSPQLRAASRAVREAMRADGRDWPPFLAVDQEGGSVNRVGAPLTRFPAPMALGAARNRELTTQVAMVSGSQLRDLGFTVVLAPSADVTSGPQDPTIGTRSPGADPAEVTTVARALLAGYRDAGVLATLKHFPGHGGVRADSHLGVARQPAPLADLAAHDLRPFADLAATTPAVMVGHVQLLAVDAANPASLSKAVVTGLLRTTQRFSGLVVSDALEMGAITDRYGAGEAAVRAVEAGCDVVLIPADTRVAIDALAGALRSGRLSRERLEESAARMVAALRHAEATPARPVSPGTARAVATALAAASITQLDGGCGERMVTDGIAIVGGDLVDRSSLAAAARVAGLAVGSGTVVRLISGAAYEAGGGAGAVAGAGPIAAGAPAAQVREDGVAAEQITVALDRPYALGSARGGTRLIATFGRTPQTFAALVDVMLGKHKAGGRLPVPVGRYPIGTGCR